MCFRPTQAELGPIDCPGCGKKVNRVAGQLPVECPFCSVSLAGMEPPAPGKPASAPKTPGAPKAPAAPTPKAP